MDEFAGGLHRGGSDGVMEAELAGLGDTLVWTEGGANLTAETDLAEDDCRVV